MKLNELADVASAVRARKRVGRGQGSGVGKTAGRGMKGQKSRSGVAIKGFEGGQMPLHRRLPKRGFNNIFAKDFNEVNLGRVQQAIDAKKLNDSKPVTVEALVLAGVLRRVRDGVRLLGNGELKSKVSFEISGASKSAISAVEKAGGTVSIIELKRPSVKPDAKPDGATEEAKQVPAKKAATKKPAAKAKKDD
jgi:large subunit ribosomal protein L15